MTDPQKQLSLLQVLIEEDQYKIGSEGLPNVPSYNIQQIL